MVMDRFLMGTVKILRDRITPMDSEWDKINITRDFHRDDYKTLNVIIKSLKRGEALKAENVELRKYKAIVENMKFGFKNNKFFFTAITEDHPIKYARWFLEDLEQKYLKEV